MLPPRQRSAGRDAHDVAQGALLVLVVREEPSRVAPGLAVLGHDFRPRHVHIHGLGHGRRYYRTDEAAARQVCRVWWRRRAPAFLCCWCCGQAADLRPYVSRAAQREHRLWSSACAAMASKELAVSVAANGGTRPSGVATAEAIDGKQSVADQHNCVTSCASTAAATQHARPSTLASGCKDTSVAPFTIYGAR